MLIQMQLKFRIWTTSEKIVTKKTHLKMQRALKAIVSVFGAFIVKITILVLQGQDSMKLILTLFIFFFFYSLCFKASLLWTDHNITVCQSW